MEELAGSVKKKQKPPARYVELEEDLVRHKDHLSRLDKVLRCLDNDSIMPEELDELKEGMEAYLVSDARSALQSTYYISCSQSSLSKYGCMEWTYGSVAGSGKRWIVFMNDTIQWNGGIFDEMFRWVCWGRVGLHS